MLLRQVQARPLQGHHLRALRRRGDAAEGAPRAHGAHRPRRARLAHLVLQGRSQPDRLPARHRSARAREGALLRRLDRHRRRRREARRRTWPTWRTRSRPSRSRSTSTATSSSPRSRGGSAPPRLPRRRQGAELRRGRRLLGPRPLELGRGDRPADARGGAQLGGGIFVELAKTITAEDAKKIRELVRQTATRDDRRLAPREIETVATAAEQIFRALDPLRAEIDKASGSKKGALTKRLHKIETALVEGTELAGDDAELVASVDTKNLERAREVGNSLLADVLHAAEAGMDPAQVRELAVRPLPRRGRPQGGPRHARAVGDEGPRDVRRHRVASRRRARGGRRRRAAARGDVEALPRARAEDGRQRRAAVPRAEGPLRLAVRLRRLLPRRNGRGGDPRPAPRPRPRRRGAVAPRDDQDLEGPEAAARDQAAEGRQRVHHLGEPPRVDDPRGRPGDPAGAAPDGAARRRPVRDERPERPLSPGDQPEQPAEAAARPGRAGDHRQQREADAAGGRRRAVRQRPPRPGGDRARATAR